MPKNIIICCDGTANQFGAQNSNVVKLYSVLEKNSPGQVAFYDPGVGTMSDPGLGIPFGKMISIGLGLLFGYGLRKNVEEAYGYLMEQYEPGDRVYLFGFSRGSENRKCEDIDRPGNENRDTDFERNPGPTYFST